MNSKTYNGWTNYETWLVKLWQDNTPGDQEFWRKQAEECVKTDGKRDAVYTLSKIMEEQYSELAGEQVGNQGVFADLIGAALRTVNWHEIAEHWVEEAIDALNLEDVELAD